MTRSIRRTRRLQVETLECRQLMAGVVEVAIRGGSLFITGDNAANTLAVRGGIAGEVTVAGSNEVGDVTQLKVNGKLVHSATLTGFSRSIYIQLNQGDDQIGVTNINVPRELNIFTHAGNDMVFVGNPAGLDPDIINVPSEFNGPVSVGGAVYMDTSSGNDAVGIVDLSIGDDLIMQAGDGDDAIGITHAVISRELRIFGGKGNDDVFIGRPNVDDITEVTVPEEVLGPVTVGRTAVVNLQDGDDDVAMVDVSVGSNLFVDVGEGNDRVRMYNHVAPVVEELTLASSMSAPASIAVRDNVFFRLGSGIDQLDVSPRGVETWSLAATLLQAGNLIQVIDPQGTSTIDLEDMRAARLEVITDGGDGEITIYDVVLGSLGIYGHSGINRVAVLSSKIDSDAFIDTGEQDDNVRVANTSARDLRVFTGSGDDCVYVQGIAIANEAYFHGQGGTDRFVISGANSWKRFRRLSFEK